MPTNLVLVLALVPVLVRVLVKKKEKKKVKTEINRPKGNSTDESELLVNSQELVSCTLSVILQST